jgi:c(7)-type cytochrome triheme protein
MMRTGHYLVVCVLLAVLAPAAMATPPIVGDVLFERKVKGSDEIPPAKFPHWVHRVKFKCFVCHNNSVGFKMKAGSTLITMDAIEDGKYCGACHKGKPAFAIGFETCNRCHRK